MKKSRFIEEQIVVDAALQIRAFARILSRSGSVTP
jgi:hypothetical protein